MPWPRTTGRPTISSPLFTFLSVSCRASYIGAVVSSYGTLMAAHRGEVVCQVTTAKPLDAAMVKEVEGALKGFLKGNEKALINYAVDPSLIGGMVGMIRSPLVNSIIFPQVVSIGDKFADMSMSSKLKKYSELIKGAA